MTTSILINPPGLAQPKGFSYAVSSSGTRTVYFAGHTASDERGAIVGAGDIAIQFEQALGNLQQTASAAGARLEDVVKMTLFVTDVEAYQAQLRPIGRIYRRFFGEHYPAMTLVGIQRLWDAEAMIEIEAMAVLAA